MTAERVTHPAPRRTPGEGLALLMAAAWLETGLAPAPDDDERYDRLVWLLHRYADETDEAALWRLASAARRTYNPDKETP